MRVVPFGVLLVEVLAFYRHVLFYGGYAIPWDLRYYHLPIAEFMAESFRRGELPLWNPYSYCGTPIYANLTAQLFYPPALGAIGLSNLAGGEHLLYFLEWQIVLHVLLGGVFAYWLLRSLGVSMAAGLLGATIFQLGGFFASQAQHLGAVNSAAWLPLAWLSVIRLGRELTWRWTAVLAASLAMSALAGFPAVTAVVAGSSLLLGAVLTVTRRAPVYLLVVLTLACAWAGLVAAIQILPTAELTRLSVAQFRSDWMGTGGGLSLQSLVSLVWPNYYGIFDLSTYSGPWQPTFLYLYCGISGFVLALAACFRRHPQAVVFLLVTGLSVLWMLGDSTAAGRTLFAALPGVVQSSVYPEFAMLSFVMGVAVLAGLGSQQLFGPGSRARWLLPVLVAVVAADLIAVGSGRPMNTGSLEEEPGLTRDSFDGSREVLESLRVLTGRSYPPDRIDTVNDSMNWAMGAALTRIPSANGNDPFALLRVMQVRLLSTGGERWGRYYEVRELDSPVLDLLNVRYLLSRTPLAGAANLRRVADLPGRHVYENPGALPRFFLVTGAQPVKDMEEGLAVMRSEDFDPKTLAVFEGPPPIAGPTDPAGEVKVLKYTPREVVLHVHSEAAAFLVTSEAYYPGWRVWVGGLEQTLAPANVAFRGLPVPPGSHRVTMRFDPDVLRRAAALSAAGLLLLTVALIFGDNGGKRGSWNLSNT